MANNTPGPWTNDHNVEISAGMKSICGMRFPFDSEENAANARLIAAAPELLEALQAAIDCGMVPTSSANEGGASKYARQVVVADMIRAAVAKATGSEA